MEAVTGLVTIDLVSRRFSDAKARVDALLTPRPATARPYLLAAAVYEIAGEAGNVEKLLRQALEVEPANPDVYGHLGELYVTQGRISDARKEFNDLLELQPRSVGALSIAGLVYGLRAALYVGAPPGAVDDTEAALPLLQNPVHLIHNLRQLFVASWLRGRLFVKAGFFGAVGACLALWLSGRERVAAAWTLCVLATIACVGYVHETRLYLPLLAFWFGYAVRERPTAA